ncbi:MAG: alanine racemase [Gammaproteobacteria bacterium]
MNPAVAEINLTALQHNFARIQTFVPHSTILPMIKADAYGHGMARVAKALPQAQAFGVARLSEAIYLRQQDVMQPLVIMSGFDSLEALKQIAALRFIPVVHTIEQLQLLESFHWPQPLFIWLKIDTGMHRLGFQISQLAQVYQRLLNCPVVQKPLGFMTHFANADDVDSTATLDQWREFTQAVKWSGPKSAANSAAILAWPPTHTEWVRPGIMLYGVSPFPNRSGIEWDLQPVMTFRTQLIAIHDLPQGAAVGYGSTWICPEPMRVGIAAAGYGDGYPRHAAQETPVLVGGKRCGIIGRVSMDLIAIDLRAQPSANLGDSVTLWGEGLPVETVAAAAETIPYELLCHVARRVRFVEKQPKN